MSRCARGAKMPSGTPLKFLVNGEPAGRGVWGAFNTYEGGDGDAARPRGARIGRAAWTIELVYSGPLEAWAVTRWRRVRLVRRGAVMNDEWAHRFCWRADVLYR